MLSALQGRRTTAAFSQGLSHLLVTGTIALVGAAYWYERIAPREALLLTLGAATLVALVTFALFDLERMVLTVVFCAMIFPQSLVSPGGSHIALSDLLLVFSLGVWIAWYAVLRRPTAYVRGNPYLPAALLFAAFTLWSVLWSRDWQLTVKQAIQIFEIVVVVPVLFASVPRSLARIRQALVTYVVFTTALSALVFFLFMRRAVAGDLSPEYLPGMHKNATGGFIGVACVIAYGLWLEGRSESRWVIWLLPLELAGLFGTVSRGAMVGTAVALLLLTILLGRRHILTMGLIAVGTAIFLVTIEWKLPGASYSSASTRPLSYAGGIRWIEAHPLLGTGAGTYNDLLPQVHIGLTDPNNLFLLTWAELGIFGLGTLLFLLYRSARVLATVRRAPQPAAALGTIAAAAAVANLVHFQFDTTWARGTATITFALIGLLLAVLRLAPTAEVAGATVPRAVDAAHDPAGRKHSLRILQVVASSEFTRAERYVLRLARGLRERGVDCRIACPFTASELRQAAARASVPVTPAAGRGEWLSQMLRATEGNPPHIVHAHDSAGAVAGWQVVGASGACLVRTHDSEPEASGFSGLEGRASAALPVGIDLPSDARVARLRSRVNDVPHPAAIFVGDLGPENGIDLLLLALARVRPRLPEFRLVIAGAVPQDAELRDEARDRGVDEGIDWLGEVRQPEDAFAHAQFAIDLSAGTSVPLFTAEAMAWGLPVVASRSSASAALVSDELTGRLFRPGDARDLAEALIELASDPDRTETLGWAARHVALQHLGIEAAIGRTVDLYEATLRAGGS
jgi:glycosyltransferase involved in cell wall biosynthesis/O-antigen ligase